MDDNLLWFLECSHNTDHGWYEVEVATTYEIASAERRERGYRPLPLIMNEGWTNDVWYKPVYFDWDLFIEKSEVLTWEQELFSNSLDHFEHAEIYLKRILQP